MGHLDFEKYIIDVRLARDNLPEGFPFDLPVIKNLETLTFHPDVTFLVGENGTGKSTLIEAIAIALGFNPEGGSKNFNFETKATHSVLYKYLKVTKSFRAFKDGYFLRADTFYNVLSEIENLELKRSSDDERSLHQFSHGESFMELVQDRFRGSGLYILDEPEAALSPSNQFKLLALMRALVMKNSQFIIATHSPILMGYPDADIYVIGENFIEKTNYEDTSHFQLTKYFLNHRENLLGEIFHE